MLRQQQATRRRPQESSGQGGLSKWQKLLPSPSSVLLLVFFILSLLMNGNFRPTTKRGFFCNDTTIQYPFKPDTVNFKWLLVVALLMPSVVIKLAERRLSRAFKSLTLSLGLRPRKDSDNCSAEGRDEDAPMMSSGSSETIKRRLVVNENDLDVEVIGGDTTTTTTCDSASPLDEALGRRAHLDRGPAECSGPLDLRRAVRETRNSFKAFSGLQLFYFGFTATSFLTGIGKMTCGRLRPHFMARCKPDVDCSLPANLFKYNMDFKCTNESLKPRDLSYISTSWPSGHASIIFFAMLYLIFYLNTVATTLAELRALRKPSGARNSSPIIFYGLHVLLIGLATFIALTRVADHHHHPLDVLSGCLIGALTAIAVGKFVMKPRFAPIEEHIKRWSAR